MDHCADRETKLTDARQDRVFFLEYLPEYTLFHSCVKGNASGRCRTGSGGVTIAAQISHKPELGRADRSQSPCSLVTHEDSED